MKYIALTRSEFNQIHDLTRSRGDAEKFNEFDPKPIRLYWFPSFLRLSGSA
jgi:hypothetical protein